jgi:hypothetical protein
LVFILPVPVDIELLSFWLRFMARLSLALVPLLGEPVVKTSPDDTAPLGLLGAGAVPLGTALGFDVLGVVCDGVVCDGVVWASAALARR